MAGEGYPDVEQLLVAWLKTELSLTGVITGDIPEDVPSNIDYLVPFIVVSRFGGTDRVLSLDNPRVDVDCFAATRDTAKALGERVRRAIRVVLPRQILDGAVITRTATFSPPTVVAWDSGPVRRVSAAYEIGVHHPI